ncbi:hypothetical protein H5410_035935 [Solanum commersonii]|uniref:Ulp1 protease family, C-terminal catalytic domain containing protein n=1 Tax=Solanum commersonii TaxID=4109 RepID=A0A9J5Y491_SOLCO|nr:hypothetical protein H5410_035935 [Solanum commersonii]
MHDQPIINNEQTLLPTRRNRRPGPYNISPYLTNFGSSAGICVLIYYFVTISGSSSSQPPIFELKHPFIFDLISGNYDIPLWDAFRSWVRDGLLTKHDKKKHDQDHYKKHLANFPVAINLGVLLINNKNWFYNLYFEGHLLNNSHIDVIFYYLRKKAKYEVGSSYKNTTVDCVFSSKIFSIWKKYLDLDGDVGCADEEHVIGEYIKGYRMHAAILWHMVDHVFVPVHRINVYDSYRATGHDAAIKTEIVKLSQLIPLKLTLNDYYKNKGIDVSDCGIYMLPFAEYLSYEQGIPAGNLDASFLWSRYATLLWNYGQQKNDAGAISDNEAPPQHSRLNVALEDNDTIQID